MRIHSRSRFGVFLLLLLFPSVGTGGICKWTDESGVVHYAEECPDDAGAQHVEIEPPPSQERIEDAQRRSEALVHDRELRRSRDEAAQSERERELSSRASGRNRVRSICVEAMMDLHNLQEGEAMYRDEDGRLHDQFSIHSESYTGERHYIEDAEHKALIERNQRIVDADCEQTREEIIARISMLAERSDSELCNRLYERVLQDRKYDRSTPVEQLQATEKAVLQSCN